MAIEQGGYTKWWYFDFEDRHFTIEETYHAFNGWRGTIIYEEGETITDIDEHTRILEAFGQEKN